MASERRSTDGRAAVVDTATLSPFGNSTSGRTRRNRSRASGLRRRAGRGKAGRAAAGCAGGWDAGDDGVAVGRADIAELDVREGD